VILAVALNPALDVTYVVERVEWHAGNRVADVSERAGGKAVNVARVLRELGHPAVVTGLAGGAAGASLRDQLAGAGIGEAFTEIAAPTRRTVVVADEARGDATGFWEPGPDVSAAEWAAFERAFAALADDADAVVLTGSVPPGVPADAYSRLGRACSCPVVLDADGEALRHGLAARPAIVKPNAHELERAGGDAAALRAAGARAVVVSHGPDGLHALTADGAWRARPPEHVVGNPTGAGDAAVAALTAGLVSGQSWPDRLRHAVALSAATVHAPVAGEFETAAYHRYLAEVTVEPLRGAAMS
jgi:tagatose 6-phosphate kinase